MMLTKEFQRKASASRWHLANRTRATGIFGGHSAGTGKGTNQERITKYQQL